jgi:thioredoxin reductase (NADPH)
VATRLDTEQAYPRLGPDLIAALDQVGTRVQLVKGDVIHRAGESVAAFYVVLSGRMSMFYDYGGPAHRPVGKVEEGRFSAELNLVTGQPAYLTTVVSQDGEAIAVTVEELQRAVSSNQHLGDIVFGAFVARRAWLIGVGAGLQVVGSRFSPDSRRLRDFLSRNRIPHRFMDVETDELAERLLRDFGVAPGETPLILGAGPVLRNPSNGELAEALNLRPGHPPAKVWDVITVGGGPAGLGAAVYAASEGLDTVMVDAVSIGGQASTSARIENYLGFPAGISGSELAERAALQAGRFGASTAVPVSASGLGFEDGYHVVELEGGEKLRGRTVVIATGAQYRRLNVDRLEEFEGAGVYYAATEVEGQLCAGSPIVVVGGANSAGQAAVFLANRASRVNLVVRRDTLDATMSRYLVDQVQAHPMITVNLSSQVSALHGEQVLEAVTITGGVRLDARAMFVFIGANPCTEWAQSAVMTDEDGFLVTGQDLKLTHLDPSGGEDGRPPLPLETSRPGVFAVGDVRCGSIKRVAAAVGEGSTAVRMIHQYLALFDAV